MADTPSPVLERRRVIAWSDPNDTRTAVSALSGLDALRAIQSGALPPPPVGTLIGFEMIACAKGAVSLRLPISELHLNGLGTVNGGILAALIDASMACAVQSVLPANRGYATLDMHIDFLRSVAAHAEAIEAHAAIVTRGRAHAQAKARVLDHRGRDAATATATFLLG